MSTTDGVRFSRVVTEAVGWGVALWLIGYVLGIILFFFLPTPVIGWLIMPVGVAITLWLLLNKINYGSVWQYAAMSIAWTVIAVAFDYVFIVRAFLARPMVLQAGRVSLLHTDLLASVSCRLVEELVAVAIAARKPSVDQRTRALSESRQ
jgi:hypothetical protein